MADSPSTNSAQGPPQPAESGSTDTAPQLGPPPAASADSVERPDALPFSPDGKTVISKRTPNSTPMASSASPLELGRSLEGERLDHFQLEEFVGGGGMGAVFRATDTELGRTVAVKVVPASHSDDETVRRFKNEAQSAARLNHENIARVYYVGQDKGWNYIVFEFIEGVNIRDLVDHKGPLSLDEAINYTLQVAEALAHATQRSVVHRDIKPSNVLIMPDGTVKLVDMGLARFHQVESSSDDLTASGVTLGTFDYISPEQARDPRNADVRSDLYSLGCTFYFMLTGRPPFPEGTVLQKLLSHSTDEPPDPRLHRPDLDEEVTVILNRLLAKNPDERYQEPSELVAQLIFLAERLGLPTARRGATVWVTRREHDSGWLETHLPWMVPLVALLALVAGLQMLPSPQVEIARPRLAARPSPAEAGADVPPVELDPEGADSGAPEDSNSDARGGDLSGGPPDRGRPSSGESTAVLASDGGPAAGFSVGPPREVAVLAARAEAVGLAPEVKPGASRLPRSSGATSSAAPAPSPPPTPPRVLVVGSRPSALEADYRAVASFNEAVEQLSKFDSLEVLELRFDGEMDCAPLGWQTDRNLVVRAGEGFRPVLLFRPEVDGLAASRRMIDLLGGDVRWEDVHFRLVLPLTPSEGWSLFHLNGAQSVDLQGCTLTIQNVDAEGLELQDAVAFFSLSPRPAVERMNQDPDGGGSGMHAPPVINLSECLARGQATLVRAEPAEPFSLIWNQGLLATSRRLLTAGGGIEAPAWDARIRIELKHVTVAAREGICEVVIDDGAPFLLDLDLNWEHCIFACRPEAPLIEHRRVRDLDRVTRQLRLRGSDNFYPDRIFLAPEAPASLDRIRWRCELLGGERREYLFSDKDQDWYKEERAAQLVIWKSPPPASLPFHDHSKWDYQQDPQLANPALAAGCDPERIPTAPLLPHWRGGNEAAGVATEPSD